MKTEVNINSLSTKQAAKWFLIHERRGHMKEINLIDEMLDRLEDVEIPEEIKKLAGHVYFRVVTERG